jgi:serine/threonine protein kinase
MSPEQARGRWDDVDGRSDLWALGATVYTLLAGEFVHEGGTVNETLAMAVTRPARSLAERRPDLHPALIRFVDKALSYDKAARFADAPAMQHALRVTYAEMQGHDVSDAPQLQVPDLESIPSSRAITLRNLTTGRGVTASEQPTVIPIWATHWRWLVATTAVAFVLILILLFRGRSADAIVTNPSPSAPAALASALGAPPPSSVAPPEPRPVRLDDLPEESPGHHSTHADASKHASGAGSANGSSAPGSAPRKASGDPFARRH